MKQWKTVLVTAVIALLVVVLALLSYKAFEPQVIRETRSRIKQYKIVREEQQLAYDILKLRYETALIQAKLRPAQPAPAAIPPPVKE